MLKRFFLILIYALFILSVHAQQKNLFNTGWEFVKGPDTAFSANLLTKNTSVNWQRIALPHTVTLEPVEKQAQHWQGICFYRKFFAVPASYKGKHIAVQFDAAMQVAEVYLNGKFVYKHTGGYLPFYIDISNDVKIGAENSILVKLDNRDNPLIPPGKPLKTLDFNYYSGLYRNSWLIVKDKLHISDAVAAGKIAGGGVFVHYENVNRQSASLVLRTEVANDLASSQHAQIRVTLSNREGKVMTRVRSENRALTANSSSVFTQNIPVINPDLWSPEHPYLYQLSVELIQNEKVIDREIIRTGIRKILIQKDVFYLNDQKVKIRGTNRHQDYPYLGNALSDNAQYRDAWKIKQAGFNFVRSSHYPQSPAFLDACDELGILVMDAIPGWQFVGGEAFQKHSYQDIRDMIRRDRNHPSIILWEASLNESDMKKDYMEKAHSIVHEELPFPDVYSAGWKNSVFDVFLPARQHAKAPDYWKKYNNERPMIIAEYGDWEYYAQNAGFDQTGYKDLKNEERTSRQLRGWGEKRLLQQALNYQEAHNDNLFGANLGDANWLMFDYNRGYADDIESSGIMDMLRLPKFAFYFYQSQVDPVLVNSTAFNKPMLFIASYWQNNSDPSVKIYSNCEEVELFLNGKSMGRQQPDKDKYSANLKHPPFTFDLKAFKPGIVTAIGYIANKRAAEQTIQTPGTAAKISLRVDYSGKSLKAGVNDIVFVYADVTDAAGTIVYDSKLPIEFKLSGDAELIGQNARAAEAGTAAILLKAGAKPGKITITATGRGVKDAVLVVNSK